MKKNIITTIIALSFIPLIAYAQSATYTQAQVAAHNTASDCWIIVSGNVYSVSSYISIHPGGKSAITNRCGGDATSQFNTRGGAGAHPSSARATLSTLLVGTLAQAATQPTPVVVTPAPVLPTPSATTTASSTLTINQNYTLCTQTAIRKRDTALTSARSAYNTAMTKALDARTAEETSAVAIVDDTERQSALIAAASAYTNQIKTAQNALKNSRQSILTTYDAEIKKCKSDKQNSSVNSSKKGSDDSSSKERKEIETESHSSSKGTLRSIQDEYKKKVSGIKSFFKSDKSSERSGKQEGRRESNVD